MVPAQLLALTTPTYCLWLWTFKKKGLHLAPLVTAEWCHLVMIFPLKVPSSSNYSIPGADLVHCIITSAKMWCQERVKVPPMEADLLQVARSRYMESTWV